MNTKYQMWLTFNAEKEKIQLPVLPSSFKTKNGSNNSSMDIVGLGEIVIMRSRPALQFSFSSFFPATRFPGVQVDSLTKPLALIERINRWKASKKPVHFIATACGVNLYVAIEDFTYSEEGGDPGTYQYSIALKEYREIGVRQVKVDMKNATASVQQGEQRVDNTVQPKTYTVVKGDCLWMIARKFYGDGAQYKKIAEANRAVIEPHHGGPNMIWPGDVLEIP